ncbi:MAG: AAA-like domain-containing protein [Deltaproteobacteria bacterium]|jgi:hypothetical protein|nr:AAA-like domain-containing protein [Deltaproteobacteria bacterium]
MSQSVVKTFNTVGPCVAEEHYLLPVLERQPGINKLIEDKNYFVLHAPRQSGKTTFLRFYADRINAKERMYALTCSLATLRTLEDSEVAMTRMAAQINRALKISGVKAFKDLAFPDDSLPQSNPSVKIRKFLNYLSVNLDKELVIFFDEADCLEPSPLVTFLAQVRDGYNERHRNPKSKFPRSMALVGMRDIRDYLSQVRPDNESKGLASPFNIKKDALTLPNFTPEEIGILYRQHTEASGQIFEDGAIEMAWYWSEGQPWLVNALAYEAVVSILNNDFSKAVTAEIIDAAAKSIILKQPVHIDSLMKRLEEPRVRRVMDAVIAGAQGFDETTISDEDIQYILDLGLLKNENEVYKPSNPIYSEVIVRKLTKRMEQRVPLDYVRRWVDGQTLDMTGLLKAFQDYWRENSEMLGAPDRLTETTPHLVSFTFIQKTLNGYVDEIKREYALGRKRVDLYARYQGVSYPVELKTSKPKHKFTDKVREESLEQLYSYMNKCGSKIGWLVVFDLDWSKNIADKKTWETIQYKGSTIHIVGC